MQYFSLYWHTVCSLLSPSLICRTTTKELSIISYENTYIHSLLRNKMFILKLKYPGRNASEIANANVFEYKNLSFFATLFFLNTYYSKRLNKKCVWSNHRSLWFTTESFSPIMEITKIYQLQIFSCLFTFYSSLGRICWKNKCYKKQVPSKIFTILRCLEINF